MHRQQHKFEIIFVTPTLATEQQILKESEMKTFTVISLLFGLLLTPVLSLSADIESLAKEGYAVVEETRIAGNYEYDGCTAKGPVRLANGKVFVCTTFGYDNNQYMPKVSILKNKNGDYRILINGNEYSGYFTNGE
jgi:hypothetical protein